eukprot:Em0007g493a
MEASVPKLSKSIVIKTQESRKLLDISPLLSTGSDEPYLTVDYSSGHEVFMAGNSQAARGVRDFPQPTLTEFDSFKTLLLVTDSSDRERVSLSRARMTRLLTPQTPSSSTPNFMH